MGVRESMISWTRLACFSFVLLVACAPASPDRADPRTLAGLTEQLRALEERYLAGDTSPALTRQLVVVAERRFRQLEYAAEHAPREAWAQLLSSAEASAFPASVRPYIERHLSLSGQVQSLVLDRASEEDDEQDAGSFRVRTTLVDAAKKRWTLRRMNADEGVESPHATRITGVAVGTQLLVAEESSLGTPYDLARPSSLKTLVLLLNYYDDASEPFTLSSVQEGFFGASDSVASLYAEQSYGHAAVTGDVYGWWTLKGHASTDCDEAAIEAEGYQLAAQHGVDPGAYDHVFMVIPDNACTGWTGLGSFGGSPTLSLIKGDTFSVSSSRHELGHNIGLEHSNAYRSCTGGTFYGAGCTFVDYGHNACVMGTSKGHFAPRHKERLRWLDGDDVPAITSVVASGTYTLEPIETQTLGVKALRIARPAESSASKTAYYFVEYRQPVGEDAFLSAKPGMTSGVVLTLAESGSSTSVVMLDMTQGTSTLSDAALAVGSVYTDASNGISIETLSASASGATVQVTLTAPSGCVQAAPSVSIAETSTDAVGAGAAKTYTVTVTNRDAGCAATAFDLGFSGLDASWTRSLSPTQLLIPSGASASSTLALSSPSSAPVGTSSFTVTATDHADSARQASGSASYTVSTCQRGVHSLTVSAAQTGAAGGSKTYTATLVNNDSGACGSSSFEVSATAPEGWTASGWDAVKTLAPGASATLTGTLQSAASAALGSYAAALVATDQRNKEAVFAALDYTVATCQRAAPTVTFSPLTQTGNGGTKSSYTATITNQNNGACASEKFALTAAAPSGFVTALSASSKTLASGASGTVTFDVTPSSAASAGSYTLSLSAKGATSGLTVQGDAEVVLRCTRATPTVTVAESVVTGAPGSALSFTLTVTNRDSTACGAQTLTPSFAAPQGFSVTVSPSSLSLAGGASDTVTARVSTPDSAALGDYVTTASVSGESSGASSDLSLTTRLVCTRSAPAISVSPASQNGSPGALRSYTVTVTNQDAAACASTTFTLGASSTTGWTKSFDTATLTLSPGASGTSTLTITPPANAASASYATTVTATSVDSGSASTTATYVSSTTCVRSTPLVTMAPTTQDTAPGVAVAYTVSVQNRDNSYCAATTFSLGKSAPTGVTATLAATSVTLAAGASTTRTLTVTPAASTPAGSYVTTVTASSATSGAGSADATTTLTCTRALPSLSASPTSQTGGPGESKSYTLTLRNNDSAACGTQSFTLSRAADGGFTTSLSATSVNLAPGASTTLTLGVTASADVRAGSYTASLSASGAASGQASASVAYVVPCVRLAPSVSVSPRAQSGEPGETLRYVVHVQNRDGTPCPSRSFALAAAVPAGWSAVFSTATLSLAPSTTDESALDVTSDGAAVDGVSSVAVTALGEGTSAGLDRVDYEVRRAVSPSDAGSEPPPDAAVATDAGQTMDGGADAADAAPPSDATAGGDGTTTEDGGASTDSGASADGGALADGGVGTSDASVPVDPTHDASVPTEHDAGETGGAQSDAGDGQAGADGASEDGASDDGDADSDPGRPSAGENDAGSSASSASSASCSASPGRGGGLPLAAGLLAIVHRLRRRTRR